MDNNLLLYILVGAVGGLVAVCFIMVLLYMFGGLAFFLVFGICVGAFIGAIIYKETK